ncbi:hypothetical protein D3C75_1229320 [compost metagenome]
MNRAAQILSGLAISAASSVTRNEPVIKGNAPKEGASPSGDHFLPNKKSESLISPLVKLAIPLDATKYTIDTMITINRSTQKDI